MSENENGLFGGSGVTLIVLILFFLTMFNGGWGGNSSLQGALTRADVQDEIQNASLQTAITNGFSNVNQNICNSNATQMLAMNNGFNSVNQNIANTQNAMQLCCCDLKSTMTKGFTDLGNLVQQNEIQSLRDKIADKDRELNSAIFAASQLTQTNNLEAYLRQIVNGGCGCNC